MVAMTEVLVRPPRASCSSRVSLDSLEWISSLLWTHWMPRLKIFTQYHQYLITVLEQILEFCRISLTFQYAVRYWRLQHDETKPSWQPHYKCKNLLMHETRRKEDQTDMWPDLYWHRSQMFSTLAYMKPQVLQPSLPKSLFFFLITCNISRSRVDRHMVRKLPPRTHSHILCIPSVTLAKNREEISPPKISPVTLPVHTRCNTLLEQAIT